VTNAEMVAHWAESSQLAASKATLMPAGTAVVDLIAVGASPLLHGASISTDGRASDPLASPARDRRWMSRSRNCAKGPTSRTDWLLERRRRAEAALSSVVATCYLLWVSTRRMDRLVQSLGITGLSRSQVSVMARDLDELVRDFRERPLNEGPHTFVAADALTMKVREGGRVIKIAVMVATGVNADGFREILGVATSTAESGAGWNGFFKDLIARGLNGVALVTSDAHAGLVDAIGANLPGASWQLCRTHYTANLMAVCPKHAWAGVKAMLHSVFDQIDAAAVHAQHPHHQPSPRHPDHRRDQRLTKQRRITKRRTPLHRT
jgi:hypothetical protein